LRLSWDEYSVHYPLLCDAVEFGRNYHVLDESAVSNFRVNTHPDKEGSLDIFFQSKVKKVKLSL
jgi:hypothetical protein